MADKVVLAYSGGLDTSVAVRWLQEEYGLKVITLTVDIGNVPDLEAIRQKALKVGAIEALVVDAKEAFIKSYVFPALQADAVYEGDLAALCDRSPVTLVSGKFTARAH